MVMQALQGAVRLEGDIITANGSILSGQIPREPGGRGSMINLDDSKSVCSCSCPPHCLPCMPFAAISRRKNCKSSGGSSDFVSYNRPGAGRSYGALSSATYSVASLSCDNHVFFEHHTDELMQQVRSANYHQRYRQYSPFDTNRCTSNIDWLCCGARSPSVNSGC